MSEARIGGARTLTVRDGIVLWFAALAPPVAWTVHLWLGWLFDEAACRTRTAVDAVEPVILVSTLACAAISLAGGLAARAIYRGVKRGELFDPRGRLMFMAVTSLLGAGLFTALTVLEGVHIAWLSACRPG